MKNNTDSRLQNVTNAQQLGEIMKQVEAEQKRQLYIENQQIIQAEELKKQTLILDEARSLTNENAGYTKKVLECTLQNQKSSTRQFWASIIIAGASLLVALFALFK